jgi:isocitrate dehydrogenase (NAD+)
VHGTAPDIVGKGIANPTAILMSGIMMLDYLGEADAARKIEIALHGVYRAGEHLTPDAGGKATTQEFTDELVAAMGRE